MKIEEYPKITVILRGYTYEQSLLIIEILSEFKGKIAVEVTTNNSEYLRIIRDGVLNFGNKVHIGVGTVLTLQQANQAIEAGAEFMLGPQKFSKEIFSTAKKNQVLTIPGVLTPTEIYEMFEKGADIVKIFPANCVGENYFKQIIGPFGNLPLMAVGGVNLSNAKMFFDAGASYIGVGSNFFKKEDVEKFNAQKIRESIVDFVEVIN